MSDYKVEFLKVSDLKPYDKNAKKHPKDQIDRIAKSIEMFGFKQNIVVDKNKVVIIGHGRLEAAKQLGLEYVPCQIAKDLDKEQINALRLADNKVAESGWDDGLLELSLDEILDIDMTDFGFEDIDIDFDEPEDDRRSSLQHNVFENQERMQFPITNFWGIPDMSPTTTYGDKFIRFCDWKECDNPSEYIAHFYYDDYKFIQAWRDPDKYLDRLREFKAIISPDFSVYTDFPRATQIMACYRRQWCGAYWQMQGIDVIPDVIWGDKESYSYCFDGVPERSVVAVSSVGVANDTEWNDKEDDLFRAGYNEMLERLKPTKIIYYGTLIDGLRGDVIRVPSFYEERRDSIGK